MLTAIRPSAATARADDLWDDVVAVCKRIPPLWELDSYVAVNPFLGFAEQPVDEAARVVADGIGGQLLPPLRFYRERWAAGAFGRQELVAAAARAGQSPATLEAILAGESPVPLRTASPTLTAAEQHDRQYGTSWNERVLRHITLWCGVAVPEGVARWGRPELAGLYGDWREAAMVDRTLEIEGLSGWRAFVGELPAAPAEALAAALAELGVPHRERVAYLYRLLAGVFGWASFLRREPWAAGGDDPGPLLDLLAMRACCDAAVAALAPRPLHATTAPAPQGAVEEESVRLIVQEALEDGYARRLLAGLNPPHAAHTARQERPALQAVFCIDVRSEPLRRHLEAQHAGIETLGFAGFFGVSLEWQSSTGSSARCPVLLQPGVPVRSLAPAGGKLAKGLLKELPTAPAAAFSFVETLGLAYGLGLVGDALTALRASAPSDGEGQAPFRLDGPEGIPLATRLDLAAGVLTNMGLRERFARVVLLCGHESHSENNPHAAGLDCGACGGHGGALNARVASALLNDPAVRAGLAERGFAVPADTRFVAAIHNTALDEVTLLDELPASHSADLAALTGWLAAAGQLTRAERAPGLGLSDAKPSLLGGLLRRRSQNWSEVRTEWALARNAAFVAARRSRTRGVDLGGRAFLHEYDWTTDPENSVLTLILTAPMVVASWINLQYMASTVDNDTFGCGNKTIHNRIGSLGVVLGNGGDLRTGLPLQSVQGPDGRWYHEPLRLQVLVEAPRERIAAVLRAHPQVAALVEHGWVRLFALEPEGAGAARLMAGGRWEPVR